MTLSFSLSQFLPRRVLVVGDLMLDTYTKGKTRRISPEAPVVIVHVSSQENLPGGAGNVALNLAALGMDVVLMGRVGSDISGKEILSSLQKEGINVEGIIEEKSYITPVKNRIIADNQQLLRIDYEEVIPLAEFTEQELIKKIPSFLEEISVIAISDYGKGFLTKTFLRELIQQAKKQSIPIVTDPKGLDFSKYQGSTLIKPNLSEAIAVSGLESHRPLDEIAKRVLNAAGADLLMITRSEAGLSLFSQNGERKDFPVRARQVKDVTGAGDTVLAVVASCLANQISLEDTCRLANIAAGIAIETVGCARITLTDIARRLLREDADLKIFNKEHLFAMQEALKKRPFVVVGLDSRKAFSPALIRKLRTLSQERDVVVYLNDENPLPETVHVLACLSEVSFIVQHGEGFDALCAKLRPQEAYLLEV